MPAIALAMFVIVLRAALIGYSVVALMDLYATNVRRSNTLRKEFIDHEPFLGHAALDILTGQEVDAMAQIAGEFLTYMHGDPEWPTTSRVVRAWRAIRPSTYLFPISHPLPLRTPRAQRAIEDVRYILSKKGIHMTHEELEAMIGSAAEEVRHAARTAR